MRKIYMRLLVFVLFLFSSFVVVNADAQIMTEVDYHTGNVTVTGTTDKQKDITVKVCKPSAGNELKFISQLKSDYLGKYNFKFNVDDIYGTYNMIVNDGTKTQKNEEIYFDIFVPEFFAKSKTTEKSIEFIEDLGDEDLVITLTLDHDPTHSSFNVVDTKLLCAVYDDNMKLIDAVQSDEILSNGSQINSFTRSVEIANEIAKKAKYIRVFLWDNETMMPYVGVWELDRQPMQDSLKILAIGNSHCENSTKFVYEFAKQLGIEEVVVGYTYSGGATLETLYNNTALKTEVPYYKKKNGEWYRSTSTVANAIKDEEWDVVFIQESSCNAGLPAVDESKYDSQTVSSYGEKHMTYLIDTIKAYCPNKDVEIGWHASFAYADAEDMSDAFPERKRCVSEWYDGSSDIMFEKCAESVRQKIVSDERFSRIIWNLTSMQNAGKILAITELSENKNLRVQDGIHIDNVGSVVAGLAWIKSLGFDIDGLERIKEPVESSVLSLNADQIITGKPIDVTFITDEQFELMKKAVNAAYENPYEITVIE